MRRIPRELLYITLDDLPSLWRARLLPLLADLPQVPTASDSALLVGPSDVTLPCLAVLARHIVQGLRDYNLTLAADRAQLHAKRRKLLFVDEAALLDGVPTEAVLCLADATSASRMLLVQREHMGLASFITLQTLLPALGNWRCVDLT
jgi:hypothetical protein